MGTVYRNRKVLVLGLGDTGMSMARWLAGRGAHVRVADTRDTPPHADALARALPGVRLDTGPLREESFSDVDLLAISPGVPLAEPQVQAAMARGAEVAGDVELFARERPRSARLVAVTGTNGKTTATAMATAICRSAGLETVAAGNIGTPVLDTLDRGRAPDVYVLELSSFQLETTTSLAADAATVLNVTEDHLDRYPDIEAYARAKARIFHDCALRVLNRDDTRSLAMRDAAAPCVTFGLNAPSGERDWGVAGTGNGPALVRGGEAVMPVADIGVPGMHNAANALAALALCEAVGAGGEPAAGALRAFRGLPHRLQLVARARGIDYLDDSKGTNVGATVAALAGLGRPAVLIAGGDGKGQDFSPLAGPVSRHARAVVLIGRDRDALAAALAGCGVPLHRADTLEQAVAVASAEAVPGDAVLLSPACASYDMFRDYRHRGEVFARAARALADADGGGH